MEVFIVGCLKENQFVKAFGRKTWEFVVRQVSGKKIVCKENVLLAALI